MREIAYYFDFASPFAYLACAPLHRIADKHGLGIAYRPLLLGGLFRSIGTPNVPLFEMNDAKRAYQLLDLVRWADHWQVPFAFPTRFPMNTVRALRLVLAAPEPLVPALVHTLFEAYWAQDRDIAEPAVLGELLATACARANVELEQAPTLSSAEEPEIKAALRSATERAEAAGVCGVPTFEHDGELLWGQDRLGLLDAEITRRRAAPKAT